MASQNIPIFLSSDNNYAPFVATTIASICDNTKSFCDFYILDGGISQENQDKICNLKTQFDNFSIEFIKIDTKKYLDSIDYKNSCSYVSISTYNRFLIPMLKQNINKVIYLDVDIVVLGDIKELFNIKLSDNIIGAIIDQGDMVYLEKLKQNLNICNNHHYFNAGVLLIDSKKWLKFDITSKLFNIEQEYRQKLKMADQDVLNKYFENTYKILNKKYNVMFDNDKVFIRHFSGYPKPWQADFYFDQKRKPKKILGLELFWKYAKMTLFYQEIIKIKESFSTSNILWERYNKIVNK